MAPRLRSAVVRFDALPEAVLRILFLALPVDARARAACVCRSWRAFLADVSLWQVLDLTTAGGVPAERLTENLARGAFARAAGSLRVFSLDDDGAPDAEIGDFLLDVIKSDGAELQELHTDAFLGVTQLEALFAAAPRLQVLNAYLAGQCAMLLPVLRSEPPYGPVRVSALSVFMLFDEDDVEEADVVVDEDEAADVMALATVMAAHEALEGLSVSCMNFARGLNALVDAAVQRRVVWLAIENCILDAESVSSLARLLQRGSLKRLVITRCPGFPHAQEESVPVLCAALRACRTLAHLTLQVSPFNGANDRTVTELLDAAAALPALVELDLSGSDVQDTVAFGHALGALLEANLPSLRILVVNNCRLDDDDVEPLLDGLAANTHLLALDCQENNYLSEAFQRDRLAHALEALAARADDDDDVE